MTIPTLRSYLSGAWYEADADLVPIHDPSTEEVVAHVSSRGADLAAAVEYARSVGGPTLRRMTFAERAGVLKNLSKVLREHRDELLEISRTNNGSTRGDGSFDVDGAGGTLAVYASIGRSLGDRRHLADGDGFALHSTDGFYGRHVLVPRAGIAVHVNAFNFPAWGLFEKLACSLLAGVPAIAKPATATAWLAVRMIEVLVEADALPEGSVQLVAGSAGDLLDHLGPQDVFAFTGSAETAFHLAGRENLRRANTRVNLEADSLNAAVLGPGAGADATGLFLQDVVREMTQKAGQKCTAVRRILVPRDRLAEVERALLDRLDAVVTGNPADRSVGMGPLATAAQLRDAVRGIRELEAEAERIHGTGQRIDGVGSPAGKGWFLGPTLLRARPGVELDRVHHREVFGPVATLIPWSGDPEEAGAIVARAEGTLVTSAYEDDAEWTDRFVTAAGPHTGRIYLGSEASAAASPGSGAVFPVARHGGPGRAGDGEEVGGLAGLRLYQQRVALQGAKSLVDGLVDGEAAGDGGAG